jgi:hypothetical protein
VTTVHAADGILTGVALHSGKTNYVDLMPTCK